ncbi:hypothetical protein HPB51_015600 [Rhipicephalus microplus]|uniref:Uncharacterized protein n=1 Tax=Rhipicephalus microplus TaxID=6941 RepID=A0A9J6DGT4_RHIMP|nr:hypothetical protein HPB51_015600 [Rhipicephalus microplus]
MCLVRGGAAHEAAGRRRRLEHLRSQAGRGSRTAEDIKDWDSYRSVAAPNLLMSGPTANLDEERRRATTVQVSPLRPASELITPGASEPGKLRPSRGTGLLVFQGWLRARVWRETLQRSGRSSDFRDNSTTISSTQRPEENLREFIYAIATSYGYIEEEVIEAEKGKPVLRQMHHELQGLVEGHVYNDLAEFVIAADGLIERAWHRLQCRALPLPCNQVTRDLAFRLIHAVNYRSLPQPTTMATASFASFAASPPVLSTYHWPLHPARLNSLYRQDRQYSCDAASPRLLYEPGQDRSCGRSSQVKQCVCSAITIVDSATFLVTVLWVDEWDQNVEKSCLHRQKAVRTNV